MTQREKTTIPLAKQTRTRLKKKLTKGETYDDGLNRLLDELEEGEE